MRETQIFFRVNGEVIMYHNIPRELHEPLINLLKTFAGINYWSKAPQKGIIKCLFENMTFKLKITATTIGMENAIIEICNDNQKILKFMKTENLGLHMLIQRIFLDALNQNASHIYINARP